MGQAYLHTQPCFVCTTDGVYQHGYTGRGRCIGHPSRPNSAGICPLGVARLPVCLPVRCLSVPLGTTWTRMRKTGKTTSTASSATVGPHSLSSPAGVRLSGSKKGVEGRGPDYVCFSLSLSRAGSPRVSQPKGLRIGLVSCHDTPLRRGLDFGRGGLAGPCLSRFFALPVCHPSALAVS